MKKEPMTEQALAAYIGSKVNSSMNREGDGLSTYRVDMLKRYKGELYGNEVEGQSKVTTREVMETVEWALPAILDVFASGDKIVVFDPVGPEDEELAEQETKIVNHHLLKKNNGFMAFYEWFKSALIHTNGYAKMWMDETQCTEVEYYEGLTEQEVGILYQQEGVEFEQASVDQMGLYSVRIRRTYTKKKLTFEAVPGNEVLIDDDLTSINLDEAEFICHRVERTYTWLVQNGFDQDKLDGIGGSEGDDFEDNSRRTRSTDYGESDDVSLRKYWVNECYLMVDFDGDGIAERRRVVNIGPEIFENEEDSYQPFVALGCAPMPHSHESISLGEMVEDLQEIRTTLVRQLLTNIYRINQPRKYVGASARTDDGMTMDMLLNGYSEVIPVNDPNGIVPESIQPLGAIILPILQEFNQIQQTRTGISPQLTLDPNVLQQSTAGAFAGALQQANQRLKLITRVFAETGVRSAMLKAHRLLRTYQDKPEAVRLNGNWVEYSPSHWRDREDMTVNVGLGFGDQAETVAQVMQIIGLQQQLAQQGYVTEQNLYNAVEKLVESSNLKNAQRYFTMPSQNQQFMQAQQAAAQQQDPNSEIARTQAQAMVMDGQSKMMRAENERQELVLKAQRDQAELIRQEKEAEHKRALERWKAMSEDEREKFKQALAEAETRASVDLKKAQTVKTSEEAKSLAIDNDQTVREVTELLDGMNYASQGGN